MIITLQAHGHRPELELHWQQALDGQRERSEFEQLLLSVRGVEHVSLGRYSGTLEWASHVVTYAQLVEGLQALPNIEVGLRAPHPK